MKIIKLELKNKYSYLWLKYVTGFDLNRHCARCLIGNYSNYININITGLYNIPLDEYNYNYIYICGVTFPYKYKNNLHLALKDKKGGIVDYQFNGEHIIIEDAEQIEIEQKPIYRHPKGIYPSYNTCRNWRFAYRQVYKSGI